MKCGPGVPGGVVNHAAPCSQSVTPPLIIILEPSLIGFYSVQAQKEKIVAEEYRSRNGD